MQTDSRVARRYAQALFGASHASGVVRGVEDDLDVVSGLLAHDARFRDFMFAPYASREDKLSFLDRAFGDRATAFTLSALRLLVEKGREAEIPEIHRQFVTLRRESEQVTYANVTSALPLDPDQKNAVVGQVERAIGKRVEATFHVDPHLIGGVKVAYGNYVLDGTVRGALGKLRERLRYELLKQTS